MTGLLPAQDVAARFRDVKPSNLPDRRRHRACSGFLAGILILIGGAVAGFAATDANARIEELRQKVEPLINTTDDVAVRHEEPLFVELLDLLLTGERQSEAEKYLKRFLQADPRAYRYQLAYGEILAGQGAPEELAWRAKQAADHAEDDVVIRRARELAGLPPLEVIPPLRASGDTGPELVLVPVGNVSDIWLLELRDILRIKTGSKVTVQRLNMAMLPADRTGMDQYVADLRRRLLDGMEKDQELALSLKATGISRAQLESDDNKVIGVVRRMLVGNKEALKDFNERLEALKKGGQQWRADLLLKQFAAAISPAKRDQRRFLAVTSVDLYAENSNFVFGMAYNGGSAGLMSAARFTADFNQDSPHRPRLKNRLLKQALSSYGQMLGVVRCSNPECARSYPHSLAEHDAKSVDLCAQCRTGFELLLGVEL